MALNKRFLPVEAVRLDLEQSGAINQFSGGAAGSVALDLNGRRLANLAEPAAASDPATKSYVDNFAVSGGAVRETLLAEVQLDETAATLASRGIKGAFLMQPDESGTTVAGHTIVFSRAANEITLTVGTEITTGLDLSNSVDRATFISEIVAGVNAAGETLFAYPYTSGQLNEYNSKTGTTSLVQEMVVLTAEDFTGGEPEDPSANPWRVHGTGTAYAFAFDFSAASDYKASSCTAALYPLTGDPGAGTAGTGLLGYSENAGGTIGTGLEGGEMHYTNAEDRLSSWNADNSTWVTVNFVDSAGIATSGVGGGDLGLITFDTDFGLEITGTGVGKVRLSADGNGPGIVFGTDGGLKVNPDGSTILINGSGQLEVQSTGGTVFAEAKQEFNLVLDSTDFTTNGYKDISETATQDIPTNDGAVDIWIYYADGSVSTKLVRGIHFSITNDENAEAKRIVFSSAVDAGLTDPLKESTLIAIGDALHVKSSTLIVQSI